MNDKGLTRNLPMLKGPLARRGYDWWWHSFTGRHHRTGEEKTFFIEYFLCNPALGQDVPVFAETDASGGPGRRPSYAMIKAGVWGIGARQIHNFFAPREFSCLPGRLEVRMGENFLSETRMTGSCSVTSREAAEHPEWMSDAGSLSWDLEMDKQIAYHVGYGASAPLRLLNVFEMFWHARGIKTLYRGKVILDGETYLVDPETSFGYADKNWGGDFTSPWLWISSCDITSRLSGKRLADSAIEFGGGRPKVFGLPLDRKLLGCVVYEGQELDFNFSKFWTGAKVDFSFREGPEQHEWTLHARNRQAEADLVLRCPREEMLLIRYVSPEGLFRHRRLWNGGTGKGELRLWKKNGTRRELWDHMDFAHTGCEYGIWDDPSP